MGRSDSRKRGFARASALVAPTVRAAGETRGFALSRLLTCWAEIAGPEVASRARPVKITYGRGRMGGTLTLYAKGADAPLVQMQAPRILDRVNAAYGYAAVAAIRLTQTVPAGLAEAQAPYAAPARSNIAELSEPARDRLRGAASAADDPDLRAALMRLADTVMRRQE